MVSAAEEMENSVGNEKSDDYPPELTDSEEEEKSKTVTPTYTLMTTPAMTAAARNSFMVSRNGSAV